VGLDEAASRLDRTKESFRERVKGMLETFMREITTMQEEFTRTAPYSHEGITTHLAQGYISNWRQATSAARTKVGLLRS
jgi:dynein heavy chain